MNEFEVALLAHLERIPRASEEEVDPHMVKTRVKFYTFDSFN